MRQLTRTLVTRRSISSIKSEDVALITIERLQAKDEDDKKELILTKCTLYFRQSERRLYRVELLLKKAYHHSNLRQALIDETLEMIAHGEVHLLGFRELARRLNVSRTAPYRHFENMEHLSAVVVEQGLQRFVVKLDEVLAKPDLDPKERFFELGYTYVTFALDHAAYYRMMFDPQFFQNDKYQEIKALSAKAFGSLLKTAGACLPEQVGERERVNLANIAWASVHGISRLFIDGQWEQIKDKPKFIRYACRKLLNLVAEC